MQIQKDAIKELISKLNPSTDESATLATELVKCGWPADAERELMGVLSKRWREKQATHEVPHKKLQDYRFFPKYLTDEDWLAIGGLGKHTCLNKLNEILVGPLMLRNPSEKTFAVILSLWLLMTIGTAAFQELTKEEKDQMLVDVKSVFRNMAGSPCQQM